MTTDFILAPGEEFIQCPYNTAHQITNARFLTHLDKCRKAYLKDLTVDGRTKNMRICRHNALHHVPKPEIKFHEDRCRDAHSIVRHMAYHNSEEGNRQYEERRLRDEERNKKYDDRRGRDYDRSRTGHGSSSSIKRESSQRSKPEPEDVKPVVNPNEWGLEEEDWEAGSCGYLPGYDPELKLKSEVVMYTPQGLTKSERKKFRNDVRLKTELSSMGDTVEFPTANSFDIKPDMNNLSITIKEEGRQSPLEPGEIDDDDEDKHNAAATSSNVDRRPPEHRHARHNNYPRPSSTSASSYQRYSNSNNSNSRGIGRPAQDDFESDDSDDFEGIDPYA